MLVISGVPKRFTSTSLVHGMIISRRGLELAPPLYKILDTPLYTPSCLPHYPVTTRCTYVATVALHSASFNAAFEQS